MQQDEIQSVLKNRVFGRTLHVFRIIDSTNQYAKGLASHGEPEGTVVYAETQTMGKGRWGKNWYSAAEMGLWFSVILRPDIKMNKVTGLTLLCTTSIADTIEKTTGMICSVKWPNDLVVQNKKVAGVLLESLHSRNRVSYVVMGIGINVCQTAQDFPEPVRESAVSLEMVTGQTVDRLSLFAEILYRLEKDYLRSQTEGFDFIFSRWMKRSHILNRMIDLKVHDRDIRGKIKGFHTNGDLVLVKPDGREKRVKSSDVYEVKHVDCY